LKDDPRVDIGITARYGKSNKALRIQPVPIAEIQYFGLIIPSVYAKRLTNRVLQTCACSVKLEVEHVAIVLFG